MRSKRGIRRRKKFSQVDESKFTYTAGVISAGFMVDSPTYVHLHICILVQRSYLGQCFLFLPCSISLSSYPCEKVVWRNYKMFRLGCTQVIQFLITAYQLPTSSWKTYHGSLENICHATLLF